MRVQCEEVIHAALMVVAMRFSVKERREALAT